MDRLIHLLLALFPSPPRSLQRDGGHLGTLLGLSVFRHLMLPMIVAGCHPTGARGCLGCRQPACSVVSFVTYCWCCRQAIGRVVARRSFSTPPPPWPTKAYTGLSKPFFEPSLRLLQTSLNLNLPPLNVLKQCSVLLSALGAGDRPCRPAPNGLVTSAIPLPFFGTTTTISAPFS
jgi:hypothetical protein